MQKLLDRFLQQRSLREKKAISLMTLASPADGRSKALHIEAFLFFYRIFPNQSRRKVILLRTSLETTDIFRGAFFICMGGDLQKIQFSNRQIASFMFKGPDLHEHDKAYINGHALVNPLQFREALNQLRNENKIN